MADSMNSDPFGGASMAPLLDYLNDGLFVVDDTCHICHFNAMAGKITGVNPKDAAGLTCHRVFTGSDTGARCAMSNRKSCTVQAIFEGKIKGSTADKTVVFPDGRKKALKMEAVPLFDKSGNVVRVGFIFQDVTEIHELREELCERYEFHNIIGRNHQMCEIYRLVEQIAETDATVLIDGESGTGKELVARAIHYSSRRKDAPFVQVNCSALVETLLESELFGHVKGSFTGAVSDKIGRFEAANGGTIFLDEIGDVSQSVQVKLLRVIQERTFERVGETKQRTTDVRIIAATNRDLKAMLKAGTFREDLYYRLRVVPVHMPTLGERKGDIPLLIDAFLKKYNQKMNKKIERVSPDAVARMLDYDWPGNVRELENSIEHAFVRCAGSEITLEHLPVELRTQNAGAEFVANATSQKSGDRLLKLSDAEEREIIKNALKTSGGSKSDAAKKLGVGRTTLWRRMKELGLDRLEA